MLLCWLTQSLVQSVEKDAFLFAHCWQQLHLEVGFQVSQQRAFKAKFKHTRASESTGVPKPWSCCMQMKREC